MTDLFSWRTMKNKVAGIILSIAVSMIAGCAKAPQNKLPEVLIGVPVSESSVMTLNALNTAAHVPLNSYEDAVKIKRLAPEALVPAKFTPPKVGDKIDFFINYDQNNDYRPMSATLHKLSEHVAWWVANDATVNEKNLNAAADNFENTTFKINRLVYGTEEQPGLDNYDRIHVLLVDMDTPEWEGLYGYFSTTNTLPRGMEPYSNEKDMMVLNIHGSAIDDLQFSGEMGHEFAHMIQYAVDPNEDLWMNEALSELSAFMVVSPVSGTVMDDPNQEVFADMPYMQLTSREETGLPENDSYLVYAHYGGEKLFTIYLLDRFGPKFIKDLIANQEAGVRALDQELGKLDPPLTFNSVYAEWIVANTLSQPDHPKGRFGYKEIVTLLPSTVVLDTFTGEQSGGYMSPYSSVYYELYAKDKLTIDFRGAPMARLTPIDPYEGAYAWYSNRGDQSSFSLTRSFDLTQVNAATLNYSVWYELEKDYDYGYVLASDNEGKTWDILPTKYGEGKTWDIWPTKYGVSDSAYGIGYTGESKAWRKESLDLSAYAGKKVTVRFLVSSDLALNRDGVQIDNIEIPEIKFFDGAENADGGWEAQGFIRSANLVPTDWIVWIIKVDLDSSKDFSITRIKLNDLQSAKFEINGFKTFDFALMIVSPTASTTTTSIDYEFSLAGK